MKQERTENTQELEIEEPTLQEQGAGIIEQMLVELADPLEIPMDSGKMLMISREQFRYYLPKDATEEEISLCFNETRMAGLNPAIRGDCHYPRFSREQPLRLFTGYPVYLRKAYENGLEHLSYEFTEGSEGELVSIRTTLEIKGRDKPFVWETWYEEVVGETGGKINWRWEKAPRSQLRKCGVVDTIRYSGMLSIPLPYIQEEMGREEIAEGYRTLTQPQLDGYEEQQESPEIGEVSATSHQIDLSPFRKRYFGILKTIKLVDDEARQNFQEKITGKRSLSDMDVDDYAKLFEVATAHKIHLGMSTEGVINPETGVEREKAADVELDIGTSDDEPVEDGMLTEKDAKEEAESQGSTQLEIFLSECALRFKTDEERDHWISGLVEKKPMEEWTITEIALIMKQLMYIDELPKEPESAADNGEDVEGSQEAEKGQEGATEPAEPVSLDQAKSVFLLEANKRMVRIVQLRDWCLENINDTPYEEWSDEQFLEALPTLLAVPPTISKATLDKIRTALEELPGKVFQTMKSSKFKAFASEALGLDEVMKTITERNEEEAQTVLAALAEKKSALLLAAMETGEVVDEDPLDQGEPEEDNIEELMGLFGEKVIERFTNKTDFAGWKADKDLPAEEELDKWPASELKRGIANIEVVPLLDGAKSEPTEYLRDDQRDRITQELMPEMPEAFRNSTVSPAFKALVNRIDSGYKGLQRLTVEAADLVIAAMEKEIADKGNASSIF